MTDWRTVARSELRSLIAESVSDPRLRREVERLYGALEAVDDNVPIPLPPWEMTARRERWTISGHRRYS